MTVTAGSFTDTDNGPGPTGSANFGFKIDFTTDYTINPGEDLVVLIRHGGYSGVPDGSSGPNTAAWNYEAFAYAEGSRVAINDITKTAHDQGTGSRNSVIKFALDVEPVPEPSGLLVAAGAAGVFALRRRRRA